MSDIFVHYDNSFISACVIHVLKISRGPLFQNLVNLVMNGKNITVKLVTLRYTNMMQFTGTLTIFVFAARVARLNTVK